MAASYQKAFPAWGRLDPCMSSHPLFFSAEIQIGVEEHGIDVARAFLFPFLKIVPVTEDIRGRGQLSPCKKSRLPTSRRDSFKTDIFSRNTR